MDNHSYLKIYMKPQKELMSVLNKHETSFNIHRPYSLVLCGDNLV